MDFERQAIMKELYSERSLSLFNKNFESFTLKNSEHSQISRKQGNELYAKVGSDVLLREENFKLYSESIRYAECDSEDLAFAYGNRSALLYRMKKYRDAISDIDRALKIHCSDTYQLKLRNRKIDCLNKLGRSPEVLKEIDTLVNELGNKLKTTAVTDEMNRIKEKFKDFIQVKNDKSVLPDHLIVLSEKEKENPFSSVTIKQNQKYGRYLIANRDFEAGEILFVENPFVKAINLTNVHMYCSRCLQTSWSTIPCDYCNWCMFCTEDCKKKAWEEYHDVECTIISHLLADSKNDDLITRNYQILSIKMIVMGLKKAGSIKSLKQELKAVDDHKDNCSRGFNKEIADFDLISIYSLNDDVSETHLKKHIINSVLVLLTVVKFSSLFKSLSLKLENIEDILKNDEILFIGSLILKLHKISDKNIQQLPGEYGGNCKYSNDYQTCHLNGCCSRGSSIVTMNSLINHSCNPSVKNVITPKQQFIVYSLEPIKKNSQIFITYITTFYSMEKVKRQVLLKVGFNFSCDCDACTNDWPKIQELMNMHTAHSDIFSPKEQEFLFVEDEIVRSVLYSSSFQCDQKTVEILSKSMKKVFMNVNQPSIALWRLKSSIQGVFEKLYSKS